jgi:hypothetical protein
VASYSSICHYFYTHTHTLITKKKKKKKKKKIAPVTIMVVVTWKVVTYGMGGGVMPPTASTPEGSNPQGVEQDEFNFVEMASGAKQKVGGKVTGCALNLESLSRGSTCTSRS